MEFGELGGYLLPHRFLPPACAVCPILFCVLSPGFNPQGKASIQGRG